MLHRTKPTGIEPVLDRANTLRSATDYVLRMQSERDAAVKECERHKRLSHLASHGMLAAATVASIAVLAVVATVVLWLRASQGGC